MRAEEEVFLGRTKSFGGLVDSAGRVYVDVEAALAVVEAVLSALVEAGPPFDRVRAIVRLNECEVQNPKSPFYAYRIGPR